MAIVKVYNKARDITYVYESTSYWDKNLKQPRSHRKLLGRLDPVTGNIIPTAKRTSEKAAMPESQNSDTDYKALYGQLLSSIERKDAIIRDLKEKLAAAENENKAYCRAIKKAYDILSESVTGNEQENG